MADKQANFEFKLKIIKPNFIQKVLHKLLSVLEARLPLDSVENKETHCYE